MAVSQHRQMFLAGRETVREFTDAWELNARRKSGEPIGLTNIPGDPAYLAYHEVCRLGSQLESVLQIFPANQVRTVVLDDICSDPATTWAGLLDFLGLRQDGRCDFDVVNPAKAVRSVMLQRIVMRAWSVKAALQIPVKFGFVKWVWQWNSRVEQPAPIPQHVQEMLIAAFYDEVLKLEVILKRDFSTWYGDVSDGTKT